VRTIEATVMYCARPRLLNSLIVQLHEQSVEQHVNLHVQVMDDSGSDTGVEPAVRALGWSYLRSASSHGRTGFWRWVNRALAQAKARPADRYVFLPDDCILCKGFFTHTERAWQSIPPASSVPLRMRIAGQKTASKGSMHLLVDDTRVSSPCWTGVRPVRVSPLVESTGWVDGAFYCERSMLEKLQFQIHPIPVSRWANGKVESSGVGQQMSTRLFAAGWGMYRSYFSLIKHVGDECSKMHPSFRTKQPLRTVRFMDDQGAPK
jgi:hypothetical protein